ncbi:MAG TPA: hypothetical protein VFW00_03685 [Rhodocyclaceae bacterium]|nr:hypothetical protein [Rhodocyclaceae bacterium]
MGDPAFCILVNTAPPRQLVLSVYCIISNIEIAFYWLFSQAAALRRVKPRKGRPSEEAIRKKCKRCWIGATGVGWLIAFPKERWD